MYSKRFAQSGQVPPLQQLLQGKLLVNILVEEIPVEEELNYSFLQLVLPADTQPLIAAASAVAETIAAIDEKYEEALESLTKGYPVSEIQTWERQRDEVLRWEKDATAPTPWIDIAAATRELDREVYLHRTLDKVNAFATASAYLTGTRQRLSDSVYAADSLETLREIVISYG